MKVVFFIEILKFIMFFYGFSRSRKCGVIDVFMEGFWSYYWKFVNYIIIMYFFIDFIFIGDVLVTCR